MKFDIDLLASLSERKQICIITELLREGWERTSVCEITWEGDRKLSQVKTQQERLEERGEVRWGEENKRKLIEVMRSEEGEDIFCPAVPRIGRGQTVLWIYLERARDSWYPPYNATLQAQRNCWCHLTHIILQQHVSLTCWCLLGKPWVWDRKRLTFLRSQGQTSLLHF